jgi:hypothetical protein
MAFDIDDELPNRESGRNKIPKKNFDCILI